MIVSVNDSDSANDIIVNMSDDNDRYMRDDDSVSDNDNMRRHNIGIFPKARLHSEHERERQR